jgi:hypothetical protein
MTSHRRAARAHALCRALALAALLLLGTAPSASAAPAGGPAPPPIDPSGDDIFLISASTAPNVILVMDNSRSMHHIEWHPAFDPEQGSYGCDGSGLNCCEAFDPDTVYEIGPLDFPDPDDKTYTYCGNTRKMYTPADPTLWDGRYLNWYLSDEADPFIEAIKNDKANIEGCTQAGSSKFFAEKYRRTRFEASKQVLLDLLCVAEPKNVRFGHAVFREPADLDSEDPNGGFLAEDLGRANPSHAAELEASISIATVNTLDVEATPLSETLFQLYTYWMPRDATQLPPGKDPTAKFPIYQYDKFGAWQTDSTRWLDDAMEFDCEKAFFVIVTDGLPTRDDFDEDPAVTAQGFSKFLQLIGDHHDDGETEDFDDLTDPDERSLYLDDIALFMQETDFRPDLGGDQTIDTYTVGLATDSATDDYLQRTADLGNGLFFHAKDGDELAIALIAALNDIIEKAASFTAAAVPSARTVDGGDFYQSFFFPQSKSAAWEGHIRAWKITASGDIVDSQNPPQCALEDPDAGECNSGPFKPDAQYFWDTHEEMPQPDARTLYTSTLDGSDVPQRTLFNTALDAEDLGIEPFTDDSVFPPDMTPNSPLYQVFGSQAKTHEGLADEVIQFVRGCFFATGVLDGSLTQTPADCLARPARLGDIFHSNPILVRHPRAPFAAPSYQAFAQAYASRTRMIYAGTNAGFLEAFHAGTWQAAATPPRYDAGTGVERWGFMPWQARLQVKKLPIDDPTARTHYVDGSPQVADVWIYPDKNATTKAADGSEWRTMLVTGMRRGGRQYLGLDITNPDGITHPGGFSLAYPGFEPGTTLNGAYGWEFPNEDDSTWGSKMGLSWAQPIITRVRVSVDDDGVPHERWVAVVTGGYDETGDPNPDPVINRTTVYDPDLPAGRAIFMIDMKSGEVLARKILDDFALDAQGDMRFAMPTTPAVLDLNSDGFADLVIVGDLGGRVFKWVVNRLGGDPVNGSALSDDVNQPKWPFKLLFQAPVIRSGPDFYHKNFFTSPAAAFANGKLWLAFGSGERLHLPYVGDASIDENNRFYVMFDPDPLELAVTPLATVTESELIDATNSPGGVTISSERGFFIKAADGEKFVTNPLIFAGKVLAASFTPTPNVDPCLSRGQATGYVFDLLTGEGFFTDASGNPDRKLDIGAGLPTDPRVSVGVGGKDNRVYIEKSGADLESWAEEDIPAGGQLLYWRENP